MSKIFVILDPGHGGIDPSTGNYVTAGKRSPIWEDGSQYFEGVGNRDIVSKIRNSLDLLCIAYGFTVKPEVWEDVPLNTRVKRANALYTEYTGKGYKVFLISIHSDGVSDPKANGTGVFVNQLKGKSYELAKVHLDEMGKAFPNIKNRGVKYGNFAITRGTKSPAILIESMFHTNPKECEILLNEEGRKKIASAVVETILRAKDVL